MKSRLEKLLDLQDRVAYAIAAELTVEKADPFSGVPLIAHNRAYGWKPECGEPK